MKFKKIIFAILTLFLFISPCAFGEEKFSSSNVKNTISELSSDKYKGRLAGDSGNEMAAEYIKNKFKEYGLLPYDDKGTYFQSFSIVVPQLKGEAFLNVINKDKKIIKKYEYGKDFKECTYGASSNGKAAGNAEFFDNLYSSSQIKGNSPIIITKKAPFGENKDSYDFDLSLKNAGVKALIYSWQESNFRFRSPYKNQEFKDDGIIKIITSNSICEEIKKYINEGNILEVSSPVQVKSTAAKNVIAKIEGKNPSLPPLVLSAHFDHVGFDADGIIYPGAFDNASGTGFLLECARILKDESPERTIIFAAFNGEEEGLIGSKYFVENPPVSLKDAECINFDMVGSKSDIPLTILSDKGSESFTRDVSKLLRSNSIENETLYEANSDHASFCENHINAVTFIHNDPMKIHTPEDNIDNISEEQIEKTYNALSTYLSSRNIGNTPVAARITYETSNNNTLISIIIIVLASSSVIYIYRKKIKKTV